VSPTSLNFGNVYAKKTSAAQTITFTNNSGQIVTFSSVATSGGDSTLFVLGTNTCTGTLASGLSCTSAVTFQPTTAGNKASSLVFTFTGAGGSPQAVALTGKANSHRVAKVL
jgi:hypothetical protein